MPMSKKACMDVRPATAFQQRTSEGTESGGKAGRQDLAQPQLPPEDSKPDD